jgi:hypothetical protein
MTDQDFGAKAHEEAEPRPAAQQAAELIARYPNLSEIELARAINLYRELSALDMALMISDAELVSKLDRFHEDHRRQLRTPFRQYAVLVCIGAVGMLVALWAATVGLM